MERHQRVVTMALCSAVLISALLTRVLAGQGAPTQIERVVTIRPGSELQLVEQGRVLQSLPLASGRYRIRINIREEN